MSRKKISPALVFWAFMILIGLVLLAVSSAQKPRVGLKGNGGQELAATTRLAGTPPMGWNSWNKFQCDVNEQLIRQMADAMVESGMRDAGYQYLIIDDCWMTKRRVNGHLEVDPATFPSGMKALADTIHAKGLKFGLYLDRGVRTCQQRAGSHGFEKVDADDLALWGVDYLKYDNCNPARFSVTKWDFQRMRKALDSTGRSIVFSICTWGNFREWMPETGNLWRSGGDISDNWDSMIGQIGPNEQLAGYAGPGHWNDPDMLEVGNGGMTDTEYRAHFSLWAIMAAPLIAGNDLRTMSKATREILTNKEVIEVDRDPLGMQCIKVWEENGMAIYSKTLQGENVRAVVLLNRNDSVRYPTVVWRDIGLPANYAKVRDLWKHMELGSFHKSLNVEVPAHGAVMLKVQTAEK